MAEAALVLAVRSVRMLFELGLRFDAVLKPAQNKGSQNPGY